MFNCNLSIDFPPHVQEQRKGDRALMNVFLDSSLFDKATIKVLQQVRRFKKVHFLSDILCTNGRTVKPCMLSQCAGVSSRIHHKMRLVDPSSPINQSSITCEPYNAILIAVEFHPRVASRMVDDFWKAVEKLKYEYLSSVVFLITKLD